MTEESWPQNVPTAEFVRKPPSNRQAFSGYNYIGEPGSRQLLASSVMSSGLCKDAERAVAPF